MKEDMENKTQASPGAPSVDAVISYITTLLTSGKLPENSLIDSGEWNNPEFDQLVQYIMDLRLLGSSLGRGDLQQLVYSKGYVLSGLKALQANLRHLTWQIQQIASGDFSQRVDFLGDFSVSFNEMVQQLETMTKQLQQVASVDALTKISNRLSLDQFFGDAFRRAKAEHTGIVAIMFDIDHFKQVNDTYGHNAGDQVLIEVTKTLDSNIRRGDILARYGGEEFLAVLPYANKEEAEGIAKRALEKVSGKTIVTDKGHEIKVTISAGISEMFPDDEDYSQIVDRCDKALYQAKNTGRNKVCVY